MPTENDDQSWDRNAERITAEALGTADGSINPNATSVDDIFDEPSTLLKLLKHKADELEVSYGSYSGRGMMGRECASISGSWNDVQTVMAETIAELMNNLVDDALDAEDDDDRARIGENVSLASKFVGQLMKWRSDQLGHGVVLYWPEIKWEDE